MIMTWFYYLNFINTKNVKRKCKFFSLPIRQKSYTILKAPMAHKNWSKEQLKLQFYKLSVSFSSIFKENFKLQNLNHGLVFALISKKTFPVFETNLLFLKKVILTFFTQDLLFFNYYIFLK